MLLLGCSKKAADDDDPNASAGDGASAGVGSAGAGAGSAGDSASAGDGASAGAGSAGSGDDPSAGNGASGTGSADGNDPDDLRPDDITPPPPEVVEMLDPDVDWEAFTIIFPTMYSAYDGVHTFQVPAHIDGTTIELAGWQAIPSDAVLFEPDPEVEGGVLITIQEPVEQITIAASEEGVGGTAALFITEGTPEQWDIGEARYANGIEFELPMIDFTQALLNPDWMPPPPPPNLACNNCHTTGAKYFEFQHTPTQAARFSDADLEGIFTTGMKPEGVGFRILPEMLGSMSAVEVYAEFHRWEATEDEIKGLIIYLRSLTPTGQGDIRLPDGTYVAPGTLPPGVMPP